MMQDGISQHGTAQPEGHVGHAMPDQVSCAGSPWLLNVQRVPGKDHCSVLASSAGLQNMCHNTGLKVSSGFKSLSLSSHSVNSDLRNIPLLLDVSDFIAFSLSVCQVVQKI